MKEYRGESAKNYSQSKAKRILLFPAVHQQIPKTKNGRLLDIGCGTGDLFPISLRKGYQYFGIDLSMDMLTLARNKYPKGDFIQADATNFAGKFDDKFDIILSLMTFLSFDNLQMITQSLTEMRKVLANNGRIILGSSHPCFDAYMQKYLFERNDTSADFKSYFSSGDKFIVRKQFKKGEVFFEDHHWLISDYIRAINKAGLKLTFLDECQPQNIKQIKWDSTFTKRRLLIPTYMVMVCQK